MRVFSWFSASLLALGGIATANAGFAHGLDAPNENLMETPEPETVAMFGAAGQWVISAERLMGLVWTNSSASGPTGSQQSTFSDVEVAFFGAPLQEPLSMGVSNPGVGVDFFPVDNLSVGLKLGFGYGRPQMSYDAEAGQGADTTLSSQRFGFAGSGRVGYSFNFGSVITLWPHLTVTGAYNKTDNLLNSQANTQIRNTFMWIGGDVMLLFRVGEGYGFSFLPEVNAPLVGTSKTSSGEKISSPSTWVVGGTMGLNIWF